MVAPVRDFGNKLFSFSFNMHSQQSSQLPTMFSTNCTEMDSLSSGPFPNNVDEVRGRTLLWQPLDAMSNDLTNE